MRYCYQGWFRFGLSVLVLWSHTAADFFPEYRYFISSFQLGNFAVACFFVLSGYLMFGAISQVYVRRPERFIINRYLRIAPPLFVAALVSICIHRFLISDFPIEAFSQNNVVYAFSSSIFPFNVLITKFFSVGDIGYDFIRYVWAVFTEIIFYWCVFLYGMAMSMLNNSISSYVKYVSFGSSFLVSLFGVCINYIDCMKYLMDFVPFSFHLQWGAHFLIGVSLFLCLRQERNARFIFSLAASASLAFVQFYLYTNKGVEEINYAPIFCYFICLGGMFVIMSWEHGVTFLGHGVPIKLDKSLGDMSYPLYINHFALSLWLLPAFQVLFSGESMVQRSLYYVGFTVLLCVVSLGIIRVTDWITDGVRNRVRGVQFS